MTQITKHPVTAEIAENALINEQQYNNEYQLSIQDPETFWGRKERLLIGLSRIPE